MEEQQQARRISAGVIAGVSALVVAIGGGTAWWLLSSRQANPPAPVSSTTETPKTSLPPTTQTLPGELVPGQNSTEIPVPTAGEPTVQIYLLKDTGTQSKLVPTPVPVKANSEPNEVLKTAFKSLLTQSNDSAIPSGTKLHSLNVQGDNVYVDLSSEFQGGGGSASMIGRLAQVLYTATSADHKAKVWISVDGKPLELLGGEGLEVPQPLTRDQFNSEIVP